MTVKIYTFYIQTGLVLYISEYKKTYLSNVLFYKIDTTFITIDKGKKVVQCRSEFENLRILRI